VESGRPRAAGVVVFPSAMPFRARFSPQRRRGRRDPQR
jgi:hypothetical protein